MNSNPYSQGYTSSRPTTVGLALNALDTSMSSTVVAGALLHGAAELPDQINMAASTMHVLRTCHKQHHV
jgi:hypothetical protein